jgi:hypothetical protein
MSNIKVSIDVSKIKKGQLFQGEKGIYLDLVLIPTPNSQYGNDYLVKQDCKDKELSKDNPVLGNGKNFGGLGAVKDAKPSSSEPEPISDDLPF